MNTPRPATTAQYVECEGTGIIHFYCCEPVAWCGHDIITEPDCPEGCRCQPCVVCVDMEIHGPLCDCDVTP